MEYKNASNLQFDTHKKEESIIGCNDGAITLKLYNLVTYMLFIDISFAFVTLSVF